MEYTELLSTFITSLGSVIVALVAAGYFRKSHESQKISISREKLMAQIKKDEIVHYAIRDLRRKYNADRIYIWQFHNGGNFYTNSPMQRTSISYERCSEGLERKTEKYQNLLVSNFSGYFINIINEEMFYSDIHDMTDIGIKSLAQSNGTKSHCSAPIYDNKNMLIGVLSLDWVFSEIPSSLIDDSGDFTEEMIFDFVKESQSLSFYL